MKKLTTEDFIKKAKQVHGDKYDYSKVEYINSNTKVCIICPEHGEFYQTPNSHLSGGGCTSCVIFQKKYILTTEDFIKKAKQVHGDKYDYSKVDYINNNTKVCITCPKHGDFFMVPKNHVYCKQGCPICKLDKNKIMLTKTTYDFVTESKKIHNNKYDYSKVEYINSHIKVCIICPEHGEFWQTPSAHINNKQGCPICGRLKVNNSLKLTTEDFIKKAKQIHGDKYDYSKVEYDNYNTQVIIICPIHGEFWQTPDSHLQGKGCKMCGITFSKGEDEIRNFLIENIGKDNFVIGNRKLIKPFELDFYIQSKNVAIEFNGIKWHSEKYKEKTYHLQKTNLCKEKGIKLIHIFEDEFHNSKEIVLNKIAHILGIQQNLPKIYGRKCKIKQINKNDTELFLTTFHIQGYVSSTVHYGAYYEDKLIAVMSFKQLVKNENKWELTRFASDYNYICCGIGGKLFKHFIKEHNPLSVKSFADRRWTVDEENNVYIQLGFKFDKYTPPDYKYVINGTIQRYHKFGFRKKILLRKYSNKLNENMSEKEMCDLLNIHRIYDCGLIRYVWNKNF